MTTAGAGGGLFCSLRATSSQAAAAAGVCATGVAWDGHSNWSLSVDARTGASLRVALAQCATCSATCRCNLAIVAQDSKPAFLQPACGQKRTWSESFARDTLASRPRHSLLHGPPLTRLTPTARITPGQLASSCHPPHPDLRGGSTAGARSEPPLPAMALRQGGRALARGLMQAKAALPTRGGGGGPIKYAPAPNAPVRLVCLCAVLLLPAQAAVQRAWSPSMTLSAALVPCRVLQHTRALPPRACLPSLPDRR